MNNCPDPQPCYPKQFYQQILCFLSQIKNALEPSAGSVRYQWDVLCNPSTGVPVMLRNTYTVPAGVVGTPAAFNLDGTPYNGVLTQLVSCAGGGGGGGGGPIRFDFSLLCNPLNGLPVLVQVEYNVDGTRGAITGVNLDGSNYTGDVTLLIACQSIAGAIRYGYFDLCNPSTGVPVVVRATYNTSGVQTGFAAFNLDGTPYGGNITLLVACGAAAVTNRFSWDHGCDPSTGRMVFVRIEYDASGNPLSFSGFFGDGSPYSGSIYNLAECNSGSAASNMLTWNPNEDTTSIVPNPGAGIQTSETAAIDVNLAGNNPLGLDLKNMVYRVQWRDIEAVTEGAYTFGFILDVFDRAYASLQEINFRIYELDPSSGYDPPTYAYTYGGWAMTSDSDGATVFHTVYWGQAQVLTAFTNLLTAFVAACGAHPALGSVDVGWGEFNENNYFSTHYAGTRTGSAPDPGGTNPLPDLTLAQAQAFYNMYRTAFGAAKPMITHITNQASFDYGVGARGMGARTDGYGWRNVGVSCACPGGGSIMCSLIPPTIASTGSFPNSWQQMETIFEIWSRFYTGGSPPDNWVANGYDYTCNLLQATAQFHASEFNTKGQIAPPTSPDVRTPFFTMLRQLGFRYVLRAMTRPTQVAAGSAFSIFTSWSNVGVAPNYRNQVIAFRLWDPVTGLKYYEKTLSTAKWNPGSPNVTSTITIPSWFPACSAQLSVAIVKPAPPVLNDIATAFVPDIQLANDGDNGQYWYSFPTAIQVTNASPTSAPTKVYGATFNGTTQYLSSASPRFRVAGFDWAISFVVTSLTLGADRALVTKGTRATAATQEYWIGYETASDRYVAKFSNGTTVYSVNANLFGPVSGNPPSPTNPHRIVVQFNNTNKILAITVNNTGGENVVGTGSIASGSNAFRVANDTASNFAPCTITQLRLWKIDFNNTNGLGPLRTLLLNPPWMSYTDMPRLLRLGLYFSFEMTEASGNRVDANIGIQLTDNGTVTRTAIATA